MEKSNSIRFRRGRKSSLANAAEFTVPERVVDAELLHITDESEEVEDDSADVPDEFKLMYVAHEGDLQGIKDLLASGVNVNYRDYDSRSALHIAACQGYSEIVEALIDSGAEIDALDRWGSTAFADAIHYKNHQVIKVLENRGAIPLACPSVKNEQKVPEYEINPQEIDFTNSIDIAKGTFCRASWRGIEVAVKQVDDDSTIDEDKRRAFRDELALVQRVRHPNVVQFLGAVTQTSPKMIVTEYLPKGDLRQYLKDNGQLKPRAAVKYALDIARGMGYLHENKPEPIIHGDLDPSNILWDVSGNLKVTGFGVSISKVLKLAQGAVEYKPVSCRYMAPELFRNEGYGPKVDVFSFALILHEMIEGCPPFSEKDGVEVAEAYAQKQRPPFRASKPYAHGLKELIERCWNEDPAERPTFREIIFRLDQISHDIGHKKRWKVQIHTISKNLSIPFMFHHRK